MPNTFGKYIVEKKIGQGGMGSVYLAVDPGLSRRVALKVISTDDKDMLERFQREAQAVAQLKHPNIVQVYEAGTVGAVHYFAMDYIEGTALDRVIKRKSEMAYPTIARIIIQASLALAYAHKHGIIHRDIKPGNILIDMKGKIYLADFGLAKQLTGLDKSMTMSGMAIGTPDFMSPEQAMGRKDEIDARSDIFSLGVTLYYCLTGGQLPFAGKELYDVLKKVVNDEPPTPSSFIKLIPKDLETICLKCMDKNKNRRYQSAIELAQDLKRYLDGEPISARRVSVMTRVWIKAKKNKLASIAIASALSVGLLAVIVWQVYAYKQKRADEGKRQADAETRKAVAYADSLVQALLTDLGNAHEEALEARREGENIEKLSKIPKRILNSAIYKQAEKEAQKDARTHYSLGRLYRIIGDNPSALIEQKQALQLDPSYGLAHYEAGILQYLAYERLMLQLWDDWRKKESERRLREAVTGKWQAPAPEKIENDEAVKLKNASLESFKKAMENLEEGTSACLTAGGIIDFINHKPNDAKKKLKQATEKNKGFDDAIILLANIYAAENDWQQALQALNMAILSDKGNTALLVKRAEINSEMAGYGAKPGGLEEAVRDWSSVLKLQPGNYTALINRGQIYMRFAALLMRRGDDPNEYFAKAENDLTKAVAIEPQNDRAYDERATMNTLRGDYCWGMWYMKDTGQDPTEYYLKAADDFTKALQLSPNDTDILYNRAALWQNFANYKKGRTAPPFEEYRKGIEDGDLLIKIKPEDAAFWSRRAGLWSGLGLCKYENKLDPSEEYSKSSEDYKKALELNPRDVTVWDGQASLWDCWSSWLSRQGKEPDKYHQEAEKSAAKAVQLKPDDSQLYIRRAMIRANYGLTMWKGSQYKKAVQKYSEAMADYKQAIKFNPTMKDGLNSRIENIAKIIEDLKKLY